MQVRPLFALADSLAGLMLISGCPEPEIPFTPFVDSDRDGVPEQRDCDDEDASLGAVAEDADCEGFLTEADCDDEDSTLLATAGDADCDGVLFADDCDDSAP